MAKNELLPFADGDDANVLPTKQWEALTDILENGFQSGIARSEQVNRVLAQGAVASYVLGQLIVDQLNKDATLDKDTLYQNIVKALQENAKDACLPLIGGTLSGNVKFSQNSALLYKNTNDGSITIRGGGNGFAYGASIVVYGKDHATNGGAFEVLAHNGTSTGTLKGKPNGPLTWNGKNVITSAGGNIDGDVTFSRWKHIATVDDANGFDICGGTSGTDGAYFSVRGNNATSYQGSFLAVSMNTDGTKHMLIGNKDGKLTWDGNDVITSAGGTFTGDIQFNKPEASLAQTASSGSVAVRGGGRTYASGASIVVYGKDHSTSKGNFIVLAHDGTNSNELIGKPSGVLTWGGHSINQYLNVSTRTSIAVDGTEVTIAFDGLLIVSGHVQNVSYGGLSVYLDGVMIVKLGGNDYDYNTLTIPVQKGQTFKAVPDNTSSSSAKLFAFK